MNSTANQSTRFAPFELNGAMPRIIGTRKTQGVVPGVYQFANQVAENLLVAHDAIIDSRVHQAYLTDTRRCTENEVNGETVYKEGMRVYLSIKNMVLLKERAHKLLPEYIELLIYFQCLYVFSF